MMEILTAIGTIHASLSNEDFNEEERLAMLTRAVNLSFTDKDPFFRGVFAYHRLDAMWQRAAIQQGWR